MQLTEYTTEQTKNNINISHVYSSLYVGDTTFFKQKFLSTNGAAVAVKYTLNDKLSSNTSYSASHRDFKISPTRSGKMENINQTFDPEYYKTYKIDIWRWV